MEYRFTGWSDGYREPTRTVNLTSDLSLTAIYEPAPPRPPLFTLTRMVAMAIGFAALGAALYGGIRKPRVR